MAVLRVVTVTGSLKGRQVETLYPDFPREGQAGD